MTIKQVSRFIVLLVVCVIATAQAQQVLVLPGAGSSTSTLSTFSAGQSFTSSRNITTQPGAFLAFMNPAASRYFIVTRSSVEVTQLDGTGVQPPVMFDQPVTGAALSPDGTKLVVVAGTATSGVVSVLDVSTGTAVESAALTSIIQPLDVAISLDGSTAYVLGPTGITPVDLGNYAVGTTVALSGTTPSGIARPGVTVGPNGLVYVNASGALYELNPTTLAEAGKIALAGFPGKPSFLPDATSAAVVNQNPYSTVNNDRIWILSLTSHAISSRLKGETTQFAQVFYVSASKAYATAPALGTNGVLFSFPPSAPGTRTSLTNIVGGVASAALSDDPSGSQYLYVSAARKITRLGIADNSVVPLTLSTAPGVTIFAQHSYTGLPVSVLRFNSDQSVVPGAISRPMVLRVLDSKGRALSGIRVKWAAAAGSTAVALQNSMTATNAQGYAVSSAVAPTANGAYTVTASFPDYTALSYPIFLLRVGTSGGGDDGGDGGTPVPAETLSMVGGTGQVLRGGDTAYYPLVVLASNGAGSPVAGAAVTFTVGANQGTLLTYLADTKCTRNSITSVTCTTDSNGWAKVRFQAPIVQTGKPNVVSTIEATSVNSSGATTGKVSFRATTMPKTGLDGFETPLPTMAVTPGTLTGKAGQTIPAAFKVHVESAPNQPLANVGVAVRATAEYVAGTTSPASCSGTGGTVLTDASGNATCNLVLGSKQGLYHVILAIGEAKWLPYTLTITEAPIVTPVPTRIDLTTGEGSSAVAGGTVNLVGTVRDQNGNIMPSTAVAWSVTSGDATITSSSAATNTAGQATAAVKVNAVGAVTVKIAAGAASNVFHLTGTAAVAGLEIVSGNPQSAVIGTAFDVPLVVKVTYASGPAVSYPVTFSATSGVTLSATTVNTDANGLASVTVTAGDSAMGAQVVASAGGMNRTFNLTVRPPGPALTPDVYLNGASFATNFISFGSIATIKTPGLTTGLNLAPGSCLTDGTIDGLPATGGLPTRIAGVEFQFGSKLAPIFAICKNADGTEQANVQVPFDVAPGTIWGIVRYGAGTPNPTEFGIPNVQLRNAAPGIFEYFVTGSTLGAVAVRPDGSVVSPTNGAKAGETIEVYVTGLGPVLPTAQSNVPGVGQKTYFTPTVKLGDKDLASVTATYAHGGIGIYLVTFQVPSDQAASAAVPLVIGVVKNDRTTAVSQTSHIAIQ